MRDHMKRILSGEVSLFAMSSSNAIVRMLGTGGPRVLHYKVRVVCGVHCKWGWGASQNEGCGASRSDCAHAEQWRPPCAALQGER